jgi:hypothetical protein
MILQSEDHWYDELKTQGHSWELVRLRASVPWITFLKPATSSYYSSVGCPSNCFPQASSASIFFERRLQSLESFSSGQHRLHINRLRASVPRSAHSRPTAPLYHLIVDFCLSNFPLAINPLSFARNTVAIYRFGCHMLNTTISPQFATLDGPVFASSALYQENFPFLRHEALHRWMHRMLNNYWASTRWVHTRHGSK